MTSIRQQARDLGVHPSTVLRAMRAGRDVSAIRPGTPHGPRPDPERADQIRTLAAQGLTSGQIACEMGIERRMTVTEIAKRHGIALPARPDSIRSVRDQIQDMGQGDAVEHLLYLLEEMLGDRDDIAGAKARLGITTAAAKIYCALRRASPRPLRRDQLLVLSAPDQTSPGSGKVVETHLCTLRKALPPGEAIRNIWGAGWYWERTQP